jgi:signal transduction histidine kinase
MAPERESQIVIGSDGIVMGTTADLPPGLVDARLEECQALPGAVREAGAALLHELRRSGTRVATRTVTSDAGLRTVRVVAVEALAIRRKATDVRALLASKLGVISFQAAAAHVALNVVVADEMPAGVLLDPEKVAWAVTTLVGNALRYVQTGSRRMGSGTITVRAGFDRARSQVTIEVEDDGPGIPTDTVTRLFKRDGLDVRGSGLALLLISDICAAHGGTVDVQSRVDASAHGTTVRLSFATR